MISKGASLFLVALCTVIVQNGGLCIRMYACMAVFDCLYVCLFTDLAVYYADPNILIYL